MQCQNQFQQSDIHLGIHRRLGIRRASQLGSQPPAHLLNRLVGLGHTAGTQDERVLSVRNRVDSDVQRRGFRAVGELDRLTGQPLVFAVVDAQRWQASQVGTQRMHASVVKPHACTAEPTVTEELKRRLDNSLSVSALPSTVGFFSSKSKNGETAKIAAGCGAPLSRSLTATP